MGEFQAVRTRHSELAFSIEQIIILNNNLLVKIEILNAWNHRRMMRIICVGMTHTPESCV